jgi:hypothetical protein
MVRENGENGDTPLYIGRKRRVMVGAIGKCVHNLGVETFADWMEEPGHGLRIGKARSGRPHPGSDQQDPRSRPEVVGVSMRLGDLHVDKLVMSLSKRPPKHGLHPRESGIRYSFGGLRPAANLVRAMTGLPLEEDRFVREDEKHYDLQQVAEKYKEKPAFPGLFRAGCRRFRQHGRAGALCQGKPPSDRSMNRRQWSDDLVERIQQVREREQPARHPRPYRHRSRDHRADRTGDREAGRGRLLSRSSPWRQTRPPRSC